MTYPRHHIQLVEEFGLELGSFFVSFKKYLRIATWYKNLKVYEEE